MLMGVRGATERCKKIERRKIEMKRLKTIHLREAESAWKWSVLNPKNQAEMAYYEAVSYLPEILAVVAILLWVTLC